LQPEKVSDFTYERGALTGSPRATLCPQKIPSLCWKWGTAARTAHQAQQLNDPCGART